MISPVEVPQNIPGAIPAEPAPATIAAAANVSEAEASAQLAAAWTVVEGYTRRAWRQYDYQLIFETVGGDAVQLPWGRYPASVTVTQITDTGETTSTDFAYIAPLGRIRFGSPGLFRVAGLIGAQTAGADIIEAVRRVALMLITESPLRAEFSAMSGLGHSSNRRRSVTNIIRDSGAGPLLNAIARV